VTVTFDDEEHVGWLGDRLRLHQVEDATRERLGGRVSVSGEGMHVFLYADSAAAAEEAEKIVRTILSERSLAATFALDRWHPLEERWEDGSKALPDTPAERGAEHRKLETDEAAESRASGNAEWEVRVDMPSHKAAVALADRMQSEGRPPVRRWKYVIVGAVNEDDARALAKTIKARNAEAKVTVEPAYGMVTNAITGTPFALFD